MMVMRTHHVGIVDAFMLPVIMREREIKRVMRRNTGVKRTPVPGRPSQCPRIHLKRGEHGSSIETQGIPRSPSGLDIWPASWHRQARTEHVSQACSHARDRMPQPWNSLRLGARSGARRASVLSRHALGRRIGAQHALDAEYFRRIDALNFSLAHDDGQHVEGIDDADVVLVGVSRTSKTPTSIYLANRGIKTANIPLVQDAPLPATLAELRKPLVVGLVASPDRIVQIRQHRVLAMKSDELTDSYVDRDRVTEEIAWSRKLCARQGWPVIDVTRRSIEETAAAIIALLAARKPRMTLILASGEPHARSRSSQMPGSPSRSIPADARRARRRSSRCSRPARRRRISRWRSPWRRRRR